MSSVLKKISADKMAFTHHPKAFTIQTSDVASDFVNLQNEKTSDFLIADVVAAQSGVQALRRKNIETQVEGTVLERLKEIEEKAYKQAYELGLIEGTQKAFEDSRTLFLERLQKFDDVLIQFEEIKTNVLKENEATIIQLIFQIAKKIAMREIKLSQEPILDLLNELILEVQGADNINVKLCPEDLSFIEDLRTKKVKEVEKLERVKLFPVSTVERGGCIVETNYGEINASVAQRVEKAWTILESKLPLIKSETEKK